MREQVSHTEYYPDTDELDEYLKWQESYNARAASEAVDSIGTVLTIGAHQPERPIYDQFATEATTTPESIDTPEVDRYQVERLLRAPGFFALNYDHILKQAAGQSEQLAA